MNLFEVNRQTRANVLKVIEGLSTAQLNHVPQGFSNNLIWNVGHLLATQQLLTYGLVGKEFLVSDNIVKEFSKGTKPECVYSTEDINELKLIFVEVINHTEEDYDLEEISNTDFTAYPTSYGVTLNTLEEAISFNNMHEAMHLGMIMSMRKLV